MTSVFFFLFFSPSRTCTQLRVSSMLSYSWQSASVPFRWSKPHANHGGFEMFWSKVVSFFLSSIEVILDSCFFFVCWKISSPSSILELLFSVFFVMFIPFSETNICMFFLPCPVLWLKPKSFKRDGGWWVKTWPELNGEAWPPNSKIKRSRIESRGH